MAKIEELNGQWTAINAVLTKLNAPRKEIVVVTGSPGTGVTWTLMQAAKQWEDSGGAALQARGEAFATERKLFPWLTLSMPSAKRLARLDVLKGSVAQSSRLLPVVGSFTSHLVDELLNHRKRRLARESVLLTAQEQDLLFVIQNSVQRKRLLLTIDHLDAWDDASWSLLTLVLSARLDELYPALANALILVGASREIPSRLRSLDSQLSIDECAIRPLEQHEMPVALSTFGIPVTTREDVKLLYDVTDGRLDLLNDFGVHLRGASVSDILTNPESIYDKLIERRMRSLKGDVRDLEDLLVVAAILGQTFTVDDVQCLTGHSTEKLVACLRLAAAEHLLSMMDGIAHFKSAALQRHFHRAKAGEHVRYHGKFAECLQTMRSAEYEYRLYHLKLAGRLEEALTCYALAALSARCQCCPVPDPEDLQDASDWSAIRAYLDTIYAAYDAYDDRRLDEGLQILDGVEGFLPDALVAERDYLEAQILLKSHRRADFQRAAELLSRWRHLKGNESGVWSRVSQVLMVALVQTDRLEEARQIEAELTTYYWSRRKVDPWAIYSLNVLRRRAECLHSLSAASRMLEDALAYFGPQEPQALPRHPIQYYYALNNLVGNLTASGRFDEAYSRAQDLDGLVRNHPLVPYPVLENAVNNFILAGYFSGHLAPAAALDLIERVLVGGSDAGDRVLMESNRAAFLIHTGRQAEAREVLERMYAEVTAGDESDAYHLYFVGNNLAALRALSGEVEDAKRLNQEIGRGLSRFYPAVRQTLQKRHELLAPAYEDAAQLNPETFDSYLTARHAPQLGPQWAFYGRGFLFSDIQFWSAD